MREMRPKSVELSPEELYRVTVVRVCQYLSKLPHEIRAMSLVDFYDVVDVMSADLEIDQRRAYLKRNQK